MGSMDGRERRSVPDVPLDDLLDEVQSRLTAVRATRDSIRALLDAVVSVGADLDLGAMVRRIVDAARTLADCRHAALSVIGEDGRRAEVVAAGMTGGDMSTRLEAPESRPGFGHRGASLDVPIRVRGDMFGSVHLSEKFGGREFDALDESIITALAAAAGMAIENARLYEDARAREVWLHASAEVTRRLLSDESTVDVLGLVARRGREMSGADAAAVMVPTVDDTPGDSGPTLRAMAVDGADDLRGLEVTVADAVVGSVYVGGHPQLVTDDVMVAESPVASRWAPDPVLAVPLGGDGAVHGVLVAKRQPGSVLFTESAMRVLSDFGQQVGIIMEVAEARHDADRHELLDDRERIARDLHDVVIQRLYAAGMVLMGAAELSDKPEVATRIQKAVEAMDDTVSQIRSTIFGLETTSDRQRRLRARITEIVQDAGEELGFAPGVQMAGPLDIDVPDALAEDAAATLRECLSNVARHSLASRCDVVVELTGGDLHVRVSDDGIGIPARGRRSGLVNLAKRAELRAGSFDARALPTGGSMIDWSVPVAAS